MAANRDSVSTLAWLVEAGAGEAIGEEAVDRFAARKPDPPKDGGPKNPKDFSESGSSRMAGTGPSPIFAAQIPALPQAQGREADSIGTAMELAKGANSLEELKAALEGFDGCGLKRAATRTVFADGNPESRIMFIGEAPGRDEDRIGLPFVGRAGKLLDKMLAAIGLNRTKAYITNVLNWRPPDNRDPSPEEAAMCLPFLRRHIELVDPQVMILLGAVAVRHVLGRSDGIMKIRGRWLEYRVLGGMVPVMPTLHPAYLLRQPAHKKLAWRDLQAIERTIASPRVAEQTTADSHVL